MHQLEHGYTKIANALLEALYKSTMPGNCLKMVIWIIRNSYGYNRKHTKTMTTREISDSAGMSRASVHWAMSILIDNGIITMLQDGSYHLNKSKLPCLVQPIGQRILSNPLDKLSNPLDKSVQPIGQTNILNLKERERKIKEREIPPTLEQVSAYCTERRNRVNPVKWFDHYAARGWLIGKAKMKDWKAAVRTWEHNDYGDGKVNAPKPKSTIPTYTPDTWKTEYDFEINKGEK